MSKKQMLIVDDNQGLREALRTVFEDEYELAFAGSGEEALRFTFKRRPEVVLMDYRMPGMDGLETLSYLKKLAPDSRTVVMSAFDDRNQVEQFLSAGATDFVGKPFDVQDIKHKIARAAATAPKLVEYQPEVKKTEPVISRREVDDMINQTLRLAACL
ncbi:MAG: response regulator [candidate division FCPU426 bacterium]